MCPYEYTHKLIACRLRIHSFRVFSLQRCTRTYLKARNSRNECIFVLYIKCQSRHFGIHFRCGWIFSRKLRRFGIYLHRHYCASVPHRILSSHSYKNPNPAGTHTHEPDESRCEKEWQSGKGEKHCASPVQFCTIISE